MEETRCQLPVAAWVCGLTLTDDVWRACCRESPAGIYEHNQLLGSAHATLHRRTDGPVHATSGSNALPRCISVQSQHSVCIPTFFIMAALCNRAGHIYFHPVVSSSFFFLSFFSSPNLSGWRLDVYHTWCGLSVNLECRSETCCTWLAENTGRKKSPKSRHLGTIPQTCRAISSQLRHVSTIGKNC